MSESTSPRVVKGMPSVELAREEFERRFRERHRRPAVRRRRRRARRRARRRVAGLQRVPQSPRTRKAGPAFADPELRAPRSSGSRRAPRSARPSGGRSDSRVAGAVLLVINGSARSDQTCPGEMSKTYRLAKRAQAAIESQRGFEVDLLDLSRLTSEYGRVIYPCKACVSTAMPLCHWPCSCYPEPRARPDAGLDERDLPALGRRARRDDRDARQLVPRAVGAEAHDRPPRLRRRRQPRSDEHARQGPAARRKRSSCGLGLSEAPRGPRVRRRRARRRGGRRGRAPRCATGSTGWSSIRAGASGALDRYIGYYEPYATSHDELDADDAVQAEARNAALSLVETRAADPQRPLPAAGRGAHGAAQEVTERRRSRCERVLSRVHSAGGPRCLPVETPAATTPRRT